MIAVLWIAALNVCCIPAAILLHRLWNRARPERAGDPAQGIATRLTFFACGLLWLIGVIGVWIFGMPIPAIVFHAILLVSQGLLYIAFFCVSESGRRFYLLEQLQIRGPLTHQQLADAYPTSVIIDRRIDRLLRWKVITEENGVLRLAKRTSFISAYFFFCWGALLRFQWFPNDPKTNRRSQDKDG